MMISIRTILILLTYSIALLGFIPLFPFIEPVARVLFISTFLAGGLADRLNRYLSHHITTAVSLFFFIFYGIQFNSANIVHPAANMIVILLGVRLAGEKSTRNHLQVFLLSLLALAASSLYSLNAIFLLYLPLLLVLVIVSLVLMTFHAKDSTMTITPLVMRKLVALATLMFAITVPLTVFFFMILPRTQYPLWDVLLSGTEKTTGFAEKIQPGISAAIENNKLVAFRAESREVAETELYWRGIVLNRIIREHLGVRVEPPAGEIPLVQTGPKVSQIIYPEPSSNKYLIGLNIPLQITGTQLSPARDHIFTRSRRSTRRIRYEVLSQPGETSMAKGVHRGFYLQLPQNVSARIRKVAEGLKQQNDDQRAVLTQLQDFYTTTRLSYSTIDLPVGLNSIDLFLFDRHKGNCELFAVSAATLLRLAGQPTRMVGGYLGGSYNKLGGYYTVTEDMAHVWVEVYLKGEGWVMVDPSKWAINAAGISQTQSQWSAKQLMMYLDFFGYYWNRAVITYDLEKQLNLLGANLTRT